MQINSVCFSSNVDSTFLKLDSSVIAIYVGIEKYFISISVGAVLDKSGLRMEIKL